LKKLGLPYQLNRVGSMFTLFFTETEVIDYETALTADTKKFAAYFRAMLQHGIYLPPSQFEAAFISLAHSDKDIEKTLRAQRAALKSLS
jgi:glutamate-1-semialdehyde 2,1-aminomutase